MEYITPYRLTRPEKLDSLVEHRSKVSLDFCEFNIFETRQKANDFHLRFEGFTITSMLRGKKVMHLEGMSDFDYVPGETVLAPQRTLMRIDFPDAELDAPTQCTALEISPDYLEERIARINEKSSSPIVREQEWKINTQDLILRNSPELAKISSRLLDIFGSDDPFKDYLVDLNLQELVVCMLKLQNLSSLRRESVGNSTKSPFHAVLEHISRHLSADIRIEELCQVACMSKSSFYRAFTEVFGLTPVQLILEQRIRHAKELLDRENISIKEAAYASGFNDPNYFSRAFRRVEGISPKVWRSRGMTG